MMFIVSDKYQEIALNLISQNASIKSARFKYKMLSYFTTFSLILSFVVILLYVSNNEILFLILFFALISAAVLTAVFKNDKELFNNVIPDILKAFKSDLKYDHYKGIDRTILFLINVNFKVNTLSISIFFSQNIR